MTWSNSPMQQSTYRKVKSTHDLRYNIQLGAQVSDGGVHGVLFDTDHIGESVDDLPDAVADTPEDPLDRGDLRTIHDEYEDSRPLALLYDDSDVIVIDNEEDARASL